VAGEPADAREHLHGRDIEVRTFSSPGLNDCVDFVPDRLAGHIGSLRVASVGNRAPPHGGGASGGVPSSASDDDGGGSKARCASSSKMVKSLDVEIHGTGGRVAETSRWASPMSSRGMVDASPMMPAQSKAGTTIACWIPSWLIRNPTKAGPIKNAA
jgi:hypothetical protein